MAYFNPEPNYQHGDQAKVGILLANLGTPNAPTAKALKRYLGQFLMDRRIVEIPRFIWCWILHCIILVFRPKKSAEKYASIWTAEGSPLMVNALKQKQLLTEVLAKKIASPFVVELGMSYGNPSLKSAVDDLMAQGVNKLIVLPLYPQFSTTTTGSSFKAWKETSSFTVPSSEIESYPTDPGFIAASVELVRQGLAEAGAGKTRVLFSAHGLPEKIVKGGDPYQRHVEQTAKAIVDAIGNLDSTVCYQSRVGPLKWIGPPTEQEIERAGRDGANVVLYPLSFVSEHSETLVELDMDYRQLASEAGVAKYVRVPTVGTHPRFIDGLARLVRNAL